MGDITLRYGNLKINYGVVSIYNGNSTWNINNSADNNLSFTTDSTGTVAFGDSQPVINSGETMQIHRKDDVFAAARDGTGTLVWGSTLGYPFIGSYNNVPMTFRQFNRRVAKLIDVASAQPALVIDSEVSPVNTGLSKAGHAPLRVVGRTNANGQTRMIAHFESSDTAATLNAIARIGIAPHKIALDSNDATAAIDVVDRADSSGYFSLKTKTPGAETNSLVERMTIDVDGSGNSIVKVMGAGTTTSSQSYMYFTNASATGSIGCSNSTWSMGAGADWQCLNGGAQYLSSSSPTGIVVATSVGAVTFLTGGWKNSNMRGIVTSAGKWGFGEWGGNTVPNPKCDVQIHKQTTNEANQLTVSVGGTAASQQSCINLVSKHDGSTAMWTNTATIGYSLSVRGNTWAGGSANAMLLSYWSGTTWKDIYTISPDGNIVIGSAVIPTEKFMVNSGNIKIDGTIGTHGLIYPDGSKQLTASKSASGIDPVNLVGSINTSNLDMSVTWTGTSLGSYINAEMAVFKIHMSIDTVTSVGTGNVKILPDAGYLTDQCLVGILSDGINKYQVTWDLASGELLYSSGGALLNVTPSSPIAFGVGTYIKISGVVSEA